MVVLCFPHKRRYVQSDEVSLVPLLGDRLYKIVGDNEEKEWCQYLDTSELGNYDYLMFANIDYSNPDVCNDVKN